MTGIRRKYKIEKYSFPVFGFNYNVQVFLSVDGGKNYYHCGIGKSCKTKQDAKKYIKEYEASHAVKKEVESR